MALPLEDARKDRDRGRVNRDAELRTHWHRIKRWIEAGGVDRVADGAHLLRRVPRVDDRPRGELGHANNVIAAPEGGPHAWAERRVAVYVHVDDGLRARGPGQQRCDDGIPRLLRRVHHAGLALPEMPCKPAEADDSR